MRGLSVLWFWSLLLPKWLRAGWGQAQKVDPTIHQVITWLEDKRLDTAKVGEEMSQELKQYLRQNGMLCLQGGVLYWCGNQVWWHHNELQLVIPPEYRLEAMCGTHDNIDHLCLKRMLDILCNRFYWLNLEADAICHVCTCEWCPRFKSKQGKAELYLLLVTYPLELVHKGLLIIENHYTGLDMNILIIMDHFTWYAKDVVTPNQLAKAMANAFWNTFIANYGFPKIADWPRM